MSEPSAAVGLVGSQIAGRYRVAKKLGQGGMGAVYLAEQETLGRQVALKVLGKRRDGEAKERFLREARAASRLNHPNIATIYEFGETEHGPFIAMEYVKGESLRKIMRKEGAMPWRRAVSLASQIARALAAAHREGIVHRDVKPENIVAAQGPQGEELKLLDFGLAALVEENETSLTETGMVMGTAGYISPEQLDGCATDLRSDLYALGVILFEMIAGKHPFAGMKPTQMVVAHATKIPPTLQDTVDGEVPESVSDFVARLLAKDPADRPADGAGALQSLAAAVQSHDSGRLSSRVMSGAGSWIEAVDDAAPQGRVSMVFTDIEGSTAMWERRPRAMQAALDLHNALLREGLRRHGGYEVKTQGDSFFLAFGDELSAMRWALETQRALAAQEWPEDILEEHAERRGRAAGEAREPALRVRMGLHVGNPNCRRDPVTGRMDYFGPAVNLCARVEAAAHGGQVLSSAAFSEALAELAAGEGVVLKALGAYRLEGLLEEEELFELVDGGSKARHFPSPRALTRASTTNIVEESSAFVGRLGEIDELGAKLRGGQRLITLLGPGGTGKTRLSRVLGASLLVGGGAFDEVWFCDLSSARDEMAFVSNVGSVLGVPLSSGQSLADASATVVRNLRMRGRVLLIIDNLEQVVAGAAAIAARWLKEAEGLHLVATSREALSIEGEERVELDALGVEEGMALFIARAEEQGRARPKEDEELRRLIQALDGMPLAIELAASRAGLMSPAQMLSRLHQRFDLLRGGRRDVSNRQATLRGAIDWSWDLLSESEKTAFAQLAVFEGGAGISAIESVLDLKGMDDAPFVLDVVQALRDKSLLRSRMDSTGEMRLGMLQSIHDYARDRLQEDAELRRTVCGRHARFYLQEGERYAKGSVGADARMCIEWLRNNQENLQAIIERHAQDEPTWAARAAMALEPLLLDWAPRELHRRILDEAIDCARDAEEPRLLVQALLLRAKLEHEGGDPDLALELVDECLELLDEEDDPVLRCEATVRRGRIIFRMGDIEASAEILQSAMPAAKKLGLNALMARILGQQALAGLATLAPSGRILDRALRLARRSGNRNLEGRVLGIRGVDRMVRGDFVEAEQEHRAALELHEHGGHQGLAALSMGNVGLVLMAQGRLDESECLLRAAVKVHEQLGNKLLEGADTANLAGTLLELGEVDEAVELAEKAQRLALETKGMRELLVCRSFLAIAYACKGRVEEARETLEAARDCSAPFFKSMAYVIELVEAHVELAAARAEGASQEDPRFHRAQQSYERLSGVRERIFLCLHSLERQLGDYRAATPAS